VETFIRSPLNGKRPLVLPIGGNFSEGGRSNVGNISSKPMEERVSLQDKQDKLTARSAKIRKNE
jgi:hypothetical protein